LSSFFVKVVGNQHSSLLYNNISVEEKLSYLNVTPCFKVI